jgi:hypothetical protein
LGKGSSFFFTMPLADLDTTKSTDIADRAEDCLVLTEFYHCRPIGLATTSTIQREACRSERTTTITIDRTKL